MSQQFPPSAPTPSAAPPPPTSAAPQAPAYNIASGDVSTGAPSKSFIATWLLSWFLGGIGVDRFYLGKIGTGILKLVTFGGLGLWWLIDLILVLAGATRDKMGMPLAHYREHRKIAWIVTAALVVLSMIIGAISGAAGGASSTSADDAPALEEPAAPNDAAEPAGDAPDAPGEADEATEPDPADDAGGAAAWADEAFGTFEPVNASGSGDDMIALPDSASGGLVTFTHEGDGHTAVTVLDASSESTGELLVNAIGAYSGATAWGVTGLGDGTTLQVTASGPWNLTIEPMSSAPSLGSGTEGSGDVVVLYEGDAGTLAVTNDGAGHFAVTQDTGSAFEYGLLVNDIGPYDGSVAIKAGPSLVTVTSDGNWSLAIS
ncbi:MAG: TM2 domain-containing protein [Pseudoclavibacter sp.]